MSHIIKKKIVYAYANNKGADQPFVVHCLDSIIPLVSITEIPSL